MKRTVIAVLFAAASGVMLAGCDVTTPSKVNTSSIQIADDMKVQAHDARALDSARLSAIAADYKRGGHGGVSIVMSYLHDDTGGQVQVRYMGKEYKKTLAAHGVQDVDVSFVPVGDPRDHGRAVVSYRTLQALAPENCTHMPGYYGAETLAEAVKYEFGCETQTIVSKMVSDPSDLLGKGGLPAGDARRAGGVVENYKAGERNPPMQTGYRASSVGGE